jgi:hypothetical protein
VQPLPHNRRSNQQAEPPASLPIHIACARLSHTHAIAQARNRQVTEAHLARALAPTEAAQNAAQYAAESTGTDPNADADDDSQLVTLQAQTAPCQTVPLEGSDPRGIRTLVASVKGRCPGPG